MSDNPILAALARLEDGQAAMRADVASLRTDMTDVRADVASLRADMISMRTSFLDELGDTRGVLITRLDRLQARIDQLQEECFIAFAQGETVRRHSDNTRAESRALAEEVSGLVRQVRMLRERIDQIEGP